MVTPYDILDIADSKVHEANMGPQSAPDGPHVGHMNLAIWDLSTLVQVIAVKHMSYDIFVLEITTLMHT